MSVSRSSRQVQGNSDLLRCHPALALFDKKTRTGSVNVFVGPWRCKFQALWRVDHVFNLTPKYVPPFLKGDRGISPRCWSVKKVNFLKNNGRGKIPPAPFRKGGEADGKVIGNRNDRDYRGIILQTLVVSHGPGFPLSREPSCLGRHNQG